MCVLSYVHINDSIFFLECLRESMNTCQCRRPGLVKNTGDNQFQNSNPQSHKPSHCTVLFLLLSFVLNC